MWKPRPNGKRGFPRPPSLSTVIWNRRVTWTAPGDRWAAVRSSPAPGRLSSMCRGPMVGFTPGLARCPVGCQTSPSGVEPPWCHQVLIINKHRFPDGNLGFATLSLKRTGKGLENENENDRSRCSWQVGKLRRTEASPLQRDPVGVRSLLLSNCLCWAGCQSLSLSFLVCEITGVVLWGRWRYVGNNNTSVEIFQGINETVWAKHLVRGTQHILYT